MSGQVLRFSARERAEHWVVTALFLVLCATGFPQRWPATGWAETLQGWFGGPGPMRWIHRSCGVALAVLLAEHVLVAAILLLRGRMRASMVPARQDLLDAVDSVRFDLGLRHDPPRAGRFTVSQKFQYWAILLGSAVMVLTGFVLWWPKSALAFLPGEAIPAARVAHGEEGLIAVVIVTVWHLWSAHLSADTFPMDPSMFTGRIPRERLRKEHPLDPDAADPPGGREALPDERG